MAHTTQHLGILLDNEWTMIATSRCARRQLSAWARSEPALTSCETLLEVHDTIRVYDTAQGQERSIAVSQAVLRLAAENQLASRVLIQVMAPWITHEVQATARILRSQGVPEPDDEATEIILDAITASLARHVGRTMPFPMRVLHQAFVETLVRKRRRRLTEFHTTTSLEGINEHTTQPNPWHGRSRIGLIPNPADPSAARVRANTLETAIEIGLVTSGDASLVWSARHLDVSCRALAPNDTREAERLRRRRSRAQRTLIDNRTKLLAAGAAM